MGVALTADLFELSELQARNLVEWPFVFGGVLFFVGGCCEVWHNKCFGRFPITAVWWVSVLNALGGLAFWLSACPTFVQGTSATAVSASGVIAYYGASVLSLFMWRGEQFGLALIPELNHVSRDTGAHIEVRRDPVTGVAHVAAKIPRSPSAYSPTTPFSPAANVVENFQEIIKPKISLWQLAVVNVFIMFGALQILSCCASLCRIEVA